MKMKMKLKLKNTCYKIVRVEKGKFVSEFAPCGFSIEYKLNKLQKAPRNTMGFFVYESLEDLRQVRRFSNDNNFQGLLTVVKEEEEEILEKLEGKKCILRCECSKFWTPEFIIAADIVHIISCLHRFEFKNKKMTLGSIIKLEGVNVKFNKKDNVISCEGRLYRYFRSYSEAKTKTVFFCKPKQVLI